VKPSLLSAEQTMLHSRRAPCTPRVRVRLQEAVSPPIQGIGLRLKSSNTGLPPRYSTVGLSRPRSLSESSSSDAPSCGSDRGEDVANTPGSDRAAGPAGWTPRPNACAAEIVNTPGSGSEVSSPVGPLRASRGRRGLTSSFRRMDLRNARSQAVESSPSNATESSAAERANVHVFDSHPLQQKGSRHRHKFGALSDMTNKLASDTETETSYSPQKRRSEAWLSSPDNSPSKRVHIGLPVTTSFCQKVGSRVTFGVENSVKRDAGRPEVSQRLFGISGPHDGE